MMKRVALIQQHCKQCSKCRYICPASAVLLQYSTFRIDPESCTGCGLCVNICPEKNINLIQKMLEQTVLPLQPEDSSLKANALATPEEKKQFIREAIERVQQQRQNIQGSSHDSSKN